MLTMVVAVSGSWKWPGEKRIAIDSYILRRVFEYQSFLAVSLCLSSRLGLDPNPVLCARRNNFLFWNRIIPIVFYTLAFLNLVLKSNIVLKKLIK